LLRWLFGLFAVAIVAVAAILAFYRWQAHEREAHAAAAINPQRFNNVLVRFLSSLPQ
jgi:Flp pilus assembly protein CpaB